MHGTDSNNQKVFLASTDKEAFQFPSSDTINSGTVSVSTAMPETSSHRRCELESQPVLELLPVAPLSNSLYTHKLEDQHMTTTNDCTQKDTELSGTSKTTAAVDEKATSSIASHQLQSSWCGFGDAPGQIAQPEHENITVKDMKILQG